MTIKKLAVSTSMLLAMGLSMPLFAQTAEEMPTEAPTIVDGDTATIECIPQAEVDAMTAEDKAKLTLPSCEKVDAGSDEKKKEEAGTAAQ